MSKWYILLELKWLWIGGLKGLVILVFRIDCIVVRLNKREWYFYMVFLRIKRIIKYYSILFIYLFFIKRW